VVRAEEQSIFVPCKKIIWKISGDLIGELLDPVLRKADEEKKEPM
jgi:hypothetical protein